MNKMIRDNERVDTLTAEYFRDQRINDRWVYSIGFAGISGALVALVLTFSKILF